MEDMQGMQQQDLSTNKVLRFIFSEALNYRTENMATKPTDLKDDNKMNMIADPTV